MKKTMKMNKNKLVNSIYRLFRSRKSVVKARGRGGKVYKYTVKTPLISYSTPTYTEKNLVLDVWESIQENSIFNKLAPLYSQVKLNKLAFKSIPRMLGGNAPKPVWIYLDTNGAENFNYQNLPEYQGSKMLSVNKNSMTFYRSTGRQTDFHYWRDLKDIQTPVGLKLRIRSEAEPTNQVFWSFQVFYSLSFRGMVLPVTESLKLKQIAEGENKIKVMENTKEEEDGQLSDSWGAEEEEINEIEIKTNKENQHLDNQNKAVVKEEPHVKIKSKNKK